MSSHPALETRHRGISLLGVLISLLVIATFAGLAIPAFFARPEITLDNACELLARDLRAAQNHAAYLGRSVAFVFHEDGYEARDLQRGPLMRGQTEWGLHRRYTEEGIFVGVRLVDIQFPESALLFSHTGEVLTEGSVVVQFEDEQRRVSVGAGFGRITIEGEDEPWVDDLLEDP